MSLSRYLAPLAAGLLAAGALLTGVAAQDAPTCETGFHLFDHELLATDPVCIPDNAQRIAAFDNPAVELLLFTDKEVVATLGAFTKDEFNAMLPVVGQQLESAEGLEWPINLEVLLELKPDLIVTYANETMVYDDLSKIAPTVILNTGIAQGDWKSATEFWSEVFGVQDLYADMLETYNARVAELQAALGEDRAETEVSLVLASSYFNMILLADSPAGGILSDVGFARPEAQALKGEDATAAYGQPTYAYLSDETLPLTDGDVIYVFTFAVLGDEAVAASDQYIADFQANPLWQSLGGVKAGNVHYVGPHWTRANTYLLANAIIDDLFATLTDTEATTPNPIETFGDVTPEAATLTCEADFRTITDAVGAEACVPEHPQRIVTLTEADLDAVLALGLTPVGTTNGRGQSTPPRYLGERLDGVESVGAFYEPNLEVVLSLDPDLILFGGFDDPAVLEQLNAIAPTINTFQNGEPWKDQLTRVGDVINESEAAHAFITSYDDRIEEVKAELGDNAEAQFIVARWSADGPQVMAPSTFSSAVLLDLGLTAPTEIPELQPGHPHSAPLSLESVGIIDVDWAFVGTLGAEGDAVTALEAAKENPLFQQLAVVQNDHVVYVDGSLWTSVGGPLAALDVLADVEAALTAE